MPNIMPYKSKARQKSWKLKGDEVYGTYFVW